MALRTTKSDDIDDVEPVPAQEQKQVTSGAFPSESVPMQLNDDLVAIVRAAIERNRKVYESLADR